MNWKATAVERTNGVNAKAAGLGYRVVLPLLAHGEFKIELELVVAREEEHDGWAWGVNLFVAGELTRFLVEGRADTAVQAAERAEVETRAALHASQWTFEALNKLQLPKEETA